MSRDRATSLQPEDRARLSLSKNKQTNKQTKKERERKKERIELGLLWMEGSEGEMGSYLIGIQFQVCNMNSLLEMGVGDVCMYFTALNCTLKNGEDGKFYDICILPQLIIFKKLKKN